MFYSFLKQKKTNSTLITAFRQHYLKIVVKLSESIKTFKYILCNEVTTGTVTELVKFIEILNKMSGLISFRDLQAGGSFWCIRCHLM